MNGPALCKVSDLAYTDSCGRFQLRLSWTRINSCSCDTVGISFRLKIDIKHSLLMHNINMFSVI